MGTGTANGGAPDASAQRLLDAIGASDLDYFSAADERAIAEALQSWPLLAAISRALRLERAANETGARRAAAAAESADPPLRVVEPADATPFEGELIEEAAIRPGTEPPAKET
jgi:hypothetical protein